jgi:hypothetical protein
MALMLRAGAVVLAGVAVAAAMANPAFGYWRASGQGSGNVYTNAAAPKLITLTLTLGTGHTVKASGTAGFASPYNSSITVVLCKDNTWPCPTARIAATLTATAGSGTPSFTVASGNLNGITVYGQASQLEVSAWKDYSSIGGPITP